MGLLCADVRHDLTRTLVAPLEHGVSGRITATFSELLAEAEQALVDDRVAPEARSYEMGADVRYQGQNYELSLPIDSCEPPALAGLADRFHELHQTVYGYHLKTHEVQLVRVRVAAVGATPRATWPIHGATQAQAVPIAQRQVLLASRERVDAPVYRFEQLGPSQLVPGPAIVEYPGSTLLVPPGWQAKFDAHMNAHMTREALTGETALGTARPETAKEPA
jgi:N-methylhydantoinase A